MRIAPSRLLGSIGLASVALIGLAACSSEPEPAVEPDVTVTETETEAEETSSTPEGQPEWANPLVEEGELISTIEVGDITVEVYQAATAPATKSGQFVSPEGVPIISEGDELVFINYVITNNGEDINLGSSLVNISERYDDWPYLQGMDRIVDRELYESLGLNDNAFATGSYVDPSIYTFGSGERYSYATNFRHQANSPITFKVTVTPVDTKGDLVHEFRTEVDGTGVIK